MTTCAPARPTGLPSTAACCATTWLGNAFADGWSTTGGEPDWRNNVENVYLPAAGDGPLHVTVSATNLLGDGVPSTGDATDQDFAVFVSGARLAG